LHYKYTAKHKASERHLQRRPVLYRLEPESQYEIRNKPKSPPANHPRFFSSSSVFDPGPKGPDKADNSGTNARVAMEVKAAA
jgi:hypothetical protein